ncbi:hypothetical protein OH407_23550, partial [Salmonella enterica]|uniref:hypothetical protein n=1 Tax=Salmonella enterica TaxID=28901 RepID=UPI0022B74DD0
LKKATVAIPGAVKSARDNIAGVLNHTIAPDATKIAIAPDNAVATVAAQGIKVAVLVAGRLGKSAELASAVPFMNAVVAALNFLGAAGEFAGAVNGL